MDGGPVLKFSLDKPAKTDKLKVLAVADAVVHDAPLPRWIVDDAEPSKKDKYLEPSERGILVPGGVQYGGIATTVAFTDKIKHDWRIGDPVPGGYLLDCEQKHIVVDGKIQAVVIARVQICPRP